MVVKLIQRSLSLENDEVRRREGEGVEVGWMDGPRGMVLLVQGVEHGKHARSMVHIEGVLFEQQNELPEISLHIQRFSKKRCKLP